MSYFNEALQRGGLKNIVENCAMFLATSKIEFDAFACRGNSGLTVAAPLAYKMDKDLLIVRKEDGSHSTNEVEGFLGGINKKIVIVDDFICFGGTMYNVITNLGRNLDRPKVQGILLYLAHKGRYGKHTQDEPEYVYGGLIEDRVTYPVWDVSCD